MKTTINGKEIELIDMDGIRFLYDKLVRNFLDIGFQLTFGDSGSHKGIVGLIRRRHIEEIVLIALREKQDGTQAKHCTIYLFHISLIIDF